MGYDYQWRMLCDEFYRQAKIEHGDMKSFAEDAQWYNKGLVMIGRLYCSSKKLSTLESQETWALCTH